MAKIILEGSVGRRGDNKPKDVETIRNRLKALGFSPNNGNADSIDFTKAVKLFQAICKGETKITGNGVDGEISLHGFTHQWLAANNAPKWVLIYGKEGNGWKSSTNDSGIDGVGKDSYKIGNGGYGTTWILDVITQAAHTYFQGAKSDYPPMWIRDCASEKGGKADNHASHQTGLDIDIRLPLVPDPVGKESFLSNEMIFEFNGKPNMSWRHLDKKERKIYLYLESIEAQLKALVAQPRIIKIFYEDDVTTSGKKIHDKFPKVKPLEDPRHYDHMHVRISPPMIINGQIK